MKNVALAAAVSDLAALLDYAGRPDAASTLRWEAQVLSSSGRHRRFETRVRGGIFTLQKALPVEARQAAVDVVSRIRSLSKN